MHSNMVNMRQLNVLANKFAQEINESQEERTVYGGYTFELPPDHKAAMSIKSGSFSCASCKFVDVESHSCNSPFYIEWNGGDKKLPDAPLSQICSDWFEPIIESE